MNIKNYFKRKFFFFNNITNWFPCAYDIDVLIYALQNVDFSEYDKENFYGKEIDSARNTCEKFIKELEHLKERWDNYEFYDDVVKK